MLMVDPTDDDDFKNLPIVEEPEPPTSRNYIKREVLAFVEQNTGNNSTIIEIIRYTWTPEIAKDAGYPSCIRFRRKYKTPTRAHRGAESCGVPEADWEALVEAIQSVKL